jgi:uncharacterized protein (TIGR02266 family)
MPRVPLVLPVRFATGPRAVQTTTRELSMQGVFVRCLEPPAEGVQVALKLYLPGTALAEDLRAIVRGVEPRAGFWAEFSSPSGEASRRIAALLETHPTPDKVPIGMVELRKARPARAPGGRAEQAPTDVSEADNRRTFPRYDAHFAVRFASVQEFVLEYAANISAGGVFVRTDNPPDLETVVQVALDLPGGGPPASAKAVVVHRVTTEQARERNTLAGVGVQFVEADDEFRERIDRAIEHILRDKQGPLP